MVIDLPQYDQLQITDSRVRAGRCEIPNHTGDDRSVDQKQYSTNT
jgi:hypothetical protein